jgi:rhodanese-related sulfurtransferase
MKLSRNGLKWILCLFLKAYSTSANGLGIVAPGQEVQFELEYENIGSATLSLAETYASCSCTTILEAPTSVSPGTRAHIIGVFRSDRLGLIDSPVQLRARVGNAASSFAILRIGGVVADPAWLLPPEKILSEGMMLIDARPEEAYARVHVMGARSLPAFALPERRELMGTSFAVYDDGIDSVAILALVAELRTAGFKQVYALRGGLAAWLRADRPVQGLVGSHVPFVSVDSWRLELLRERGEWSVVSVGNEARQGEFSSVLRLAAIDALAEQAQRPENAHRRWVLLSPDRNIYEQIEARLPTVLHERLFFLAGGPAALAEHIRVAGVLAARESYIATSGETPLRSAVSTISYRPSSRCSSCGK